LILIYDILFVHVSKYRVRVIGILLLHRDLCNSRRWVLVLPFSVGTRSSFQILDFYNGGLTKIFQNVIWTHQNKLLQVSVWYICTFCNFSIRLWLPDGKESLFTYINLTGTGRCAETSTLELSICVWSHVSGVRLVVNEVNDRNHSAIKDLYVLCLNTLRT
jgi:hypothetical protein